MTILQNRDVARDRSQRKYTTLLFVGLLLAALPIGLLLMFIRSEGAALFVALVGYAALSLPIVLFCEKRLGRG